MTNAKHTVASAALLALLAAPVFAQDALTGVEALDDRIDDIQDAAEEDLARGDDAERYGPLGVAQGWQGSLALSASATSGNTDTGEASLAGRLTYGTGAWSHSFGFAGEYGETDGTQTEEKFFGTYEANRYFTPEVYVFGTARAEYDGFATNKVDGFLGFGPGYRVLNTNALTWRVQAGPGVRYTETQNGEKETEAGWIASSRYYYGLTDTVSLTMDTDVLGSNANTVATNDFGVNFKVTDTLSTRVSYRTEYNSDPLPGLKDKDNTIGLSLVMGF